MKPLENLVVLEFCQFMAGPSAGLRLADMGARVIKIERPGKGESGRQISIKNLFSGDDGIVFHTINRNKESYAADLKNPEDLKRIKKLIEQADVMTHNFRPGVMEKIGLDYDTVKAINPRIVYGVVTGYGNKGPWASKPGQDLLLQSLSGLTFLSGDKNDAPTPFGLAVADMLCGAHFVQGILAALIRRGKTKTGALVEVSLLESILDFQFEVITTYLNDGGKLPDRAMQGNGHAYLSAPYGVYKTKDRHLALAMEDLHTLGETLGCYELLEYKSSDSWFVYRDDIMRKLGLFLKERTTAEWLAVLEPADIWCADILNYEEFLNHAGYKALQMEQETITASGDNIRTTRCPIRIDGQRLFSFKPAPAVGEHVKVIERDFNLSAGYGNAS
ncbi:CaiB/BaiF CoA-transferase family protein [Pontibacter sp. 13R65]|uniref:CaiB/BaiF CoA transferase family protein n=1 Tax=Pontibacter sp. 13R65 TaxID=3127458 RepID=UPI00301C3D38